MSHRPDNIRGRQHTGGMRMPYTDDRLQDIFDRSAGRCHICGDPLAFSNYGQFGRRGAWEVEHSTPRARGGTDRLSNLYPAHIDCNRAKGASSTRWARAGYRRTRAPMSVDQREETQIANTFAGAGVGLLLAGIASRATVGDALSPGGVLFFALVGALVGYNLDPEE